MNISIIRGDVLSIDIVSQSTCYTSHLGGIKYENDILSLLFSHESVKPPNGFHLIGHQPNDIIEVPDCSTNYLFGFTIQGIEKLPESIQVNGRTLKDANKIYE